MKSKKKSVYYLVCLLMLFVIFFCLPYCHDEWRWGLPSRIELMKNGFSGYNGRYLGNILSIIITRSHLVKAFLMTGIMAALFYEIVRLVKEKVSSCEGMIIFLLLVAPLNMVQQIYGWSAAFVNFVPPIVLLLHMINEMKKWNNKEEAYRGKFKKGYLSIALLGISMQLFSEHNTIINLVIAAGACIYLWRTGKRSLESVIFLLSTLLGAAVMFTNSAYLEAGRGTGIKEISLSVKGMIVKWIYEISDPLILYNIIINAGIVLLIYILYRNVLKKKSYITIYQGFYIGYSLFRIVARGVWIGGRENLTMYLDACLSMVFVISVLYVLFCYLRKADGMLLVNYILYIFSALPLIIADPIGWRCFYFPYILSVVFLLRLYGYVRANTSFELMAAGRILQVANLVILCIVTAMFIHIGFARMENERNIKTAVENKGKEISIKELPYQFFYWTTVPGDKAWEKSYKEFYKIPQNTKLIFTEE